MKKIISAVAVAVVLSSAPALAQAQEASLYGNLGYANVDNDIVNLGALEARLGIQVTSHLAFEAEAAVGLADDTVLGTPVELTSSFGLFAVGRLPVTENIDLLARVGAAGSTFDVGGAPLREQGKAYGLGIQSFFSPNDGVRLDYTRYDFDDVADVWSLSYVRKF